MADKTDQKVSQKKSGVHAPGGVDRSREGRGGPTTTGPGETSISRHSDERFRRPGLEDIGGTGTDMDESSDDRDFDEAVNRQKGTVDKGRPIDEDYD